MDATKNEKEVGTTHSGLRKDSIIYQAIVKYRQQFRSTIPADYSAYYHFGTINLVMMIGIGLFVYGAGGVKSMFTTPLSLLMMVIGFFFSNYVEYWAHRSKLHPPLGKTRHAVLHHRFFTDRYMEFDDFNDALGIFFPRLTPFFLIPFISVVSLIPMFFVGFQSAMAFAATLGCYYLTYEWLHLAYHASPTSFLGRLPGIPYLRHHHQVHHSQTLMGDWNFNITFPIADAIFGTTFKGPFISLGIPDVKRMEQDKNQLWDE